MITSVLLDYFFISCLLCDLQLTEIIKTLILLFIVLVILGRVRLGSIRNKNNWNNAS